MGFDTGEQQKGLQKRGRFENFGLEPQNPKSGTTVYSQYVIDCLWYVKTHESEFTTRVELHWHYVLNTS